MHDTQLFGTGAPTTTKIGGTTFITGNAPNMDNALMIAANIIYKF